jgi:hypothetical protein
VASSASFRIRNGASTIPKPRETLFEFHRIGAFVKVTAIDVETGIEIAIVGPANGGESLLRANARRKLDATLRKRMADPP